MNTHEQMRADWDRRAKEDPFYYVAFARPHQSREEFLNGAPENLQAYEAELARLPRRHTALEIGCGPGRLMLPMSRHFAEIHGVDISPAMVELARATLKDVPGAQVHVTPDSTLGMLPDGAFDFVYSYAVFQHIPEKDVVRNYLQEAQRVLSPGGVLCCQLRGAPPVASESGQPSTWNGCSFTWEEIREFASQRVFPLVAVSGLQTQYTMVTLRKPHPEDERGGQAILRAASSAVASGSSVPRKGRGAMASLWCAGLPASASLLDFDVRIQGLAAFPVYHSHPFEDGGSQLNVELPRGCEAGPAPVEAAFRGRRLTGSATLQLTEPALPGPSLLRVRDAVNLTSTRVTSGSAKILIDNVENPAVLRFEVDGAPGTGVEHDCIDLLAGTYEYCFRLPPAALRPGSHRLVMRAGRWVAECALET